MKNSSGRKFPTPSANYPLVGILFVLYIQNLKFGDDVGLGRDFRWGALFPISVFIVGSDFSFFTNLCTD
jgi:hypothetical protein